jgi:hypothetical protein
LTAAATSPAKNLAALVFEDNAAANRIVMAFAAGLRRDGHRIGGMIQAADAAQDCECRDTFLHDVETGETLSLLQDLGRGSKSCRVDTAALAEAAHRIARAIERAPDLLFVNRFGKLEAAGMGLYAEIGAAAAAGLPTLVCVSARFIDPWRRFTMGLDEELPCSEAALQAWWRDLNRATRVGEKNVGAAFQ